MVMVALAMTALLLFGALAIDVGAVWASRTQSQNADDAAALAAAQAMIEVDGMTNQLRVDIADAEAEAIEIAGLNSTVGNPTVQVRAGNDFEFGFWDPDDHTLDTGVDLMDPDLVTGVRVAVVMNGDDEANERSPSFFSRLLGRDGFEVRNTAVAYRGFQGSFLPGEFDLPITISSCVLSEDDDGCGSDFCEEIATPPNPCELTEAQDTDGDGDEDPGTQFTCLQFSNTPDQNACWTAFDDTSTSASRVRRLIERDNAPGVEVGEEIDLSNGDIASAWDEVKDKFYGDGGYSPAAADRYFQSPTMRDSWVVKLPVVECQSGAHCAGGASMAITGGVCFEIREVVDPPGPELRTIKGRFLCPNSSNANVRALFDQYCRDTSEGGGAPGGCNFGLRADRAVLVQ